MTNALIPIEEVNAIELFMKHGELVSLLRRIEKEALSIVPDLETATGRKKIASDARNVAKSKGVIENAGKDLVSDWKSKAKVVDIKRKQSRDFLDRLRDLVRKPLTDYEAEQIRIAEEERLAAELIADEIEAYAEHDIYLREQVIKEKETEIARAEEERQREEVEKKAAEDEDKRLEKIRIEAEERAKQEADETIKAERERAEQAYLDKLEAEEKAKREKAEAGERARLQAEQVERDRIAAEEHAEEQRLEAVEQERRRAEERAAAERREAAARAADQENRRKVNNKIVDAFKAEGMGEKTAQSIVRLVASGGIPHMGIRY